MKGKKGEKIDGTSMIVKLEDNENSEITFELHSKTSIYVLRNGKQIGNIWSKKDDGTTPYPHDTTSYCLNSIQICGFDRMSTIWSCGPYTGKKDCVIHFIPYDNESNIEKLKQYEKYVASFVQTKVKEVELGETKISIPISTVKKDITKLKSFSDWLEHDGIIID